MLKSKFRAWKAGFPWMMQVLSLEMEPERSERDGDALLLDHPCPMTAIIKRRFLRFKVKTLTIMESSGLKDSKGVEIFEGDILSNGFSSGVVRRDRSEWAFGEYRLENKKDGSLLVLGNVYENPELLTGGVS